MSKVRIAFKFGRQAFVGCVLIYISSPVFADSGNLIDREFASAASFYKDSNNVELDDWSLAYDYNVNKNTRVGVEAHRYYATAGTNRDKYDGNEITANIKQKYNDFIETEASVGAVFMDNRRTDKRKNHVKYKAKITLKPTTDSSVSLEHSNDLLFKEAIINDDDNNLLSGKTTKVSGSWRVSKRFIAEGSSQRRKLSDGNVSKHKRAALLYGISPGVPWVWAGVEAQSLSYDQRKANYWSPSDYKAYALIANGNFPVSKKLSMNMSASVNRTKEKGQSWASGYSAGVGADFAVNENSHVKADALYLKSSRDGVDWDSSRVGVSYTHSHF